MIEIDIRHRDQVVLGQLTVRLKKEIVCQGYSLSYTQVSSGEIKDSNVSRKTWKSTGTKVGIILIQY